MVPPETMQMNCERVSDDTKQQETLLQQSPKVELNNDEANNNVNGIGNKSRKSVERGDLRVEHLQRRQSSESNTGKWTIPRIRTDSNNSFKYMPANGKYEIADDSDSEVEIQDGCQAKDKAKNKDGGWAWMVVAGSFVVYILIPGMVLRAYGAIYLEILEAFPESSAAEAGWIPALLTAIMIGLAPISGMLAKVYGCHTVVFAGGLCCSLGLVLSSFGTSILYLNITFGIVCGIGAGLSTTPSIIAISQYFVRRRAFANGLCLSGTAFGSFLVPSLISLLLEEYRFRGTLLIMGGLVLNVCACGLLYIPDGMIGARKKVGKLSEKQSAQANGAVKMPLDNKNLLSPNGVKDPSGMNEVDLLKWVQFRRAVEGQTQEEQNNYLSTKVAQARNIWEMSRSLNHSINDVHTASVISYCDNQEEDNDSEMDLLEKPTPLTMPIVRNASVVSFRNHSQQPSRFGSVRSLVALPGAPPVTACSSISNFGKPETTHKKTHDGCLGQLIHIFSLCLDVSLFKLPSFVVSLVSGSALCGSVPHVVFFLPALAIAHGVSKRDAAVLVSVSAGGDLLGRIGYGWVMDLNYIKRTHGYVISGMIGGVATLCIPLVHSYAAQGVLSFLYGFGSGACFMLLPVILADLHGVERLPSTYGLLRLFQGMVSLVIPPTAGVLKDTTGSYDPAMWLMGSLLTVSSCVMLFMDLAIKAERKQDTVRVTDDKV